MRMVAYDTSADALDEYLNIGKQSNALQCLDKFAWGWFRCLVGGGVYLWRPTQQDLERLLQVNKASPRILEYFL
jgi:hypothetical protein